jgi:hypothetical protein
LLVFCAAPVWSAERTTSERTTFFLRVSFEVFMAGDSLAKRAADLATSSSPGSWRPAARTWQTL